MNLYIQYVKIARIDHWFKNVFMVPGFILALLFKHISPASAILPILIAILSTCMIASANYVINEWLDAEFDRHHPVKRNRPSVVGKVKVHYVYFEYFLLSVSGLSLASLLNKQFLILSTILLVMGIFYNVPPIRLKERVYLDVLSESINNPLRLMLGWSALISGVIPPSSVIIAYWMGGAFLMTVKRFSEFRSIGNPEVAGLYRQSFMYYTEEKLLLCSFFYALTSAFFLGIFLIKYRIELLLSFPFFALLFSWYLAIGIKSMSLAQDPEKLYREHNFVAYIFFLCALVLVLLVVHIPWLERLTRPLTF